MGRSRFAIAAFVLVGFLGGPASASVDVQGSVSTSAGYNSNVTNAPTNASTTPGAPPVEADEFFDVRPSLSLSGGNPRAVHRLGYTFSANLFLEHSNADSYSHALDWAGFFLPSPTTDLLVTATGSYAQVNTITALRPSEAQTLQVTRPGETKFADFGVSESLGWTPTAAWRMSSGTGFRVFVPVDTRAPNVYDANASVGLDRTYRRDALGAELRIGYVDYTSSSQQFLNSLLAHWKRDWTHFWSTELAAGVTESNCIECPSGEVVFGPAGLAAVRYTHPNGVIELNYRHGVTPNAISASTFEIDEVNVRGTVPLPEKTRMSFSTGSGYQHGRTILNTGSVSTPIDLVSIDASLGWAVLPELSAFARYQFFDQLYASMTVPGVERHVAMVGVSGTIGSQRRAARVPSRQSGRVDRSDMPDISQPRKEEE